MDVFKQIQENPTNVLASMTADEIATLLEQASAAYYNSSKPLLSDELFDMVKDHLKRVSPRHPFLKKIGAPVGQKVDLPYWMGSLDKIRDDNKQLEKWKTAYQGSYIISDKLDGNSAMIVYTKQRPVLYSRGDGYQGQDISHLLPYISGLPNVSSIPIGTAIRGELIIPRKVWEEVKHIGANARNVVAGVMHSKVPDPSIARRIDFVAYEEVSAKGRPDMQHIASLGFKVVHHVHIKDANRLTMDTLSEMLLRRRKESEYDIDGLVVVHDAPHKAIKGRNPKYGFAFKSILTHEEAEVVVSEVEWNVSKDGYLKPLVHFEPVVIAGVTISKATGFNALFIEKHAIGPGSRVVIIRSGDVIPHILRIVSPSSNGKPSFPSLATTNYKWNDTHVDIIVCGVSSQMTLKQMEHFCSSLDVKHVAKGTLKKMYENGIDTIPKLTRVTVDELLKMDGFQKTSATRIVESINSTMERATCEDLMVASNVFGRGLGKTKIALIASQFPDIIIQRKPPTKAELLTIDGIGENTAKSFLDNLPSFYSFLDEIGIQCQTVSSSLQVVDAKDLRFSDQIIVFTGFRNKEWESRVYSLGGKVTSTVTKNTTLVVAADIHENTTKLVKAREYGVRVMTQTEFEKLL